MAAAKTSSRESSVPRRGPWGTSRQTEAAFGYPPPVRGRVDDVLDDLYRRLDALEATLDGLEATVAALGAEYDQRLAELELRVPDLETRV